MADLRVKTGTRAPDRKTADGAWAYVRGLRDGSLSVADFLMVSAMEGRAFGGNAGSVTTPITFGAGTIDTTEPDFDLNVPSGTLVIPTQIIVYMEAFGTNAQFECMAATGTGGVFGTTGGTAVTIKNLRADAPYTSNCSAIGNVDASGATYMTGNVFEFWRDGQQFAITKTTASATASVSDPNKFVWRLTDSMVPPILYSSAGISRLNVFASSQAGTGFITVTWVEFPGADVS